MAPQIFVFKTLTSLAFRSDSSNPTNTNKPKKTDDSTTTINKPEKQCFKNV